MSNFFFGISGLVLPVTKKNFPPEFVNGTRLSYYASLYNSIEINSSFYKIPRASTVAKWVTEVPPHFRFTFKLFKDFTHSKNRALDEKELIEFMEAIKPAENNMGCVLIQFPPSVRIGQLDKIQQLLQEISYYNTADWPLAVEFRHTSLYEREVAEILEEYNASTVINDIPESATPPRFTDSDVAYFRYHGPGGKYRGSYEDDFLKREADKINHYRRAGKTVYTYFNNTIGEANKNLDTLIRFCELNDAK